MRAGSARTRSVSNVIASPLGRGNPTNWEYCFCHIELYFAVWDSHGRFKLPRNDIYSKMRSVFRNS